PDEFLGTFYADGATRENLRALVESLQDGVSELMCHPGHPDDELRRFSDYSDEREREVQILCDPDVPNLLDRHGVVVIGFDRIYGRPRTHPASGALRHRVCSGFSERPHGERVTSMELRCGRKSVLSRGGKAMQKGCARGPGLEGSAAGKLGVFAGEV